MTGEQLFDLWVLHVRPCTDNGAKHWHELTPSQKDRWNAFAADTAPTLHFRTRIFEEAFGDLR